MSSEVAGDVRKDYEIVTPNPDNPSGKNAILRGECPNFARLFGHVKGEDSGAALEHYLKTRHICTRIVFFESEMFDFSLIIAHVLLKMLCCAGT
jgi:hypothetical protein